MALKVGPNSATPSVPSTPKPTAVDQAVQQLEKLVDNTLSSFEQANPAAKAQLEKIRGAVDSSLNALAQGLDQVLTVGQLLRGGTPQPAPAPAPAPASTPAPAPAPTNTSPATPTPAPALSAPSVDLKQGDTGSNVDLLQRDLVKLGYMSDADRNTGPGIFGPHTLASVEGFQAAWGLPVTGYYGPMTRDALAKALSGQKPPPQPAGENPAAVAREYLGRNAADLQKSSDLDMDKWVPDTEDCANFVSAALEKAHDIPAGQHSDNVNGLVNNLKADGWQSVPLSQAQPGDVVTFDGPLGPNQHVELFNAWVNGKPQYIGSNNINPDGSQQVSYDTGSWAYNVHVWHNPHASTSPAPSPAPAPTPAPSQQYVAPQVDLQQGDTGSNVNQLQQDLIKLGYLKESDYQTGPGIFGPHTEAALKAFQSSHGVPNTGYYGPLSRAALEKALSGAPAPAPAPAPSPTPVSDGTGVPSIDLQQGNTGAQVEMLQKDLVKLGFMSQAAMNTGPGTFGPHTLAAVEDFQSRWGLPVTGYFGPMSRDAMAKALAGQQPPNPAPASPGNYPTWLQTDPRWSGMRLIDGSPGENIGPYGCAMTSTAMLLAGSGRKINGQTISSPVVLNQYLQQHQNPADGDLLEWQTAAQSVGFNAHYVSGSQLNANLAAGHPCVMNIHAGGHWVLVTGHDSQGYICHDPATGTVRHLAAWELNPWNGWAMY